MLYYILYMYRSSQAPILSQYGMECLFFDLVPPRSFDFDQKLTQNVGQIILYYHMIKQFLPCLFWLTMMLSIFEYVLVKQLLSILMKNCYKTFHKWLFNITGRNIFFVCILRLITCFHFQNIIWKTEEYHTSKNIELVVKFSILILFRFCVFWWLSPVFIVAASCYNYLGRFR